MSENRTNSSNLLNPENGRFRGQEKVNAEIFTAIEILGRKLERTENERNRLADRLEMIESAASVDEETGKIYLPAVIGSGSPSQNKSASYKLNFLMFTSLVSSVFAIASFAIVLLQNPSFSFEKILAPQTTSVEEALTDKEKTVMVEDTAQAPSTASVEVTDNQTQTAEVQKQSDVQAVAEGINSAEAEEEAPDEAVLDQNVQDSAVEETAQSSEEVNSEQTSKTDSEVIPDHIKAGAEKIMADEAAQADINAAINAADNNVVAQADEEPVEAKQEQKTVVKEQPVVRKDVAKPVVNNAAKVDEQDNEVDYVSYDMPADGDLTDALKKLEKAAYSGVAEAQHDLGVYYAEGQMVQQDYKRAVYWLKKASVNGVSNASYNLAVMYQQGMGVEQNSGESLKYYNAAAELGHPEAMYDLGIIYFDGKGAEKNVAKGISFFKRAAEAGVSEAAYNLGVLYESDLIGGPDLNKAAEWYRKAAKSGYQKADEALKRLGSSYAMTKVEKTDVYSQ